jgi:hypothetical protein
MSEPQAHPTLRHIEPIPFDHDGRRMVALRDPSGISDAQLAVTPQALAVLALMDGKHTAADIRLELIQQYGAAVPLEQIEGIIEQLDEAWFLETPRFDALRTQKLAAYRNAAARPSRPAETFGPGKLSMSAFLEDILLDGDPINGHGEIVGLVVPHLDYPRGRPCYAAGYRALQANCKAKRFVILGTNHFGQATSVTATSKDFDTPLGVLKSDAGFLYALRNRLGVDLCKHEFDHLNEHSIELQVLFLRHLFVEKDITIVPFLCPDPCGPTGTAPADGTGVDLRDFAAAVRELIATDETPTCVIAGADLSHVGAHFGDDRELDADFLAEVRERDMGHLGRLGENAGDGFVLSVARGQNMTRVCSAGCIFTAMSILKDAIPEVLRYHQAVDFPSQTCVTCAAVAFTRP